jgi:hypothetical protein
MKACRPYLQIGNLLVQNVFDNSVTPATLLYIVYKPRELRLHLNVVPTGTEVFKSRHIFLHKYVNRIMITYL